MYNRASRERNELKSKRNEIGTKIFQKRILSKNKTLRGLHSNPCKGGTLYFLVDFAQAFKSQFC